MSKSTVEMFQALALFQKANLKQSELLNKNVPGAIAPIRYGGSLSHGVLPQFWCTPAWRDGFLFRIRKTGCTSRHALEKGPGPGNDAPPSLFRITGHPRIREDPPKIRAPGLYPQIRLHTPARGCASLCAIDFSPVA